MSRPMRQTTMYLAVMMQGAISDQIRLRQATWGLALTGDARGDEDAEPRSADPFAGTVPDGDAVFGTDPFASFPSSLPPAALNGDAGDTQEMHLKAFGDGGRRCRARCVRQRCT